MFVPISKSRTISTLPYQPRSATASDSINNIAGASLNEGCQFNNRNVCEVCDKLFSNKKSLKVHMLIHTGKKLHSCTDCDKAFAKKYDLKIHMQVHTVEKPHSCTECDKAFARKWNLKKHMQTHRKEKFFKCTVCDKCFPFMKRLIKHLKVDHQVAEVSKINLSNCNNIRDNRIANYHQEIQDICKNRKIKIFTKAIKNMIFILRATSEKLLTNKTLNSFFDKTLLFLKHMTIPNSTATLTNMLLNRDTRFNNGFNHILYFTDEQLQKIASYKYIHVVNENASFLNLN